MPSTSSLVTARVGAVPTSLPFFITATRSARSNTSWMSWLMRKMPMPFLLELDDEIGDLLGLLRAQRGRRLVHDQHAGVEVDRPRDGDGLALAARERAHRLLELGEVRIEARHHLARLDLHGDVVERAPAAAQFAAQEQVGRGVEILGQRQGLVDRLDAVAPGVARAVDRGRPTVDRISPASGR